MRLSIENNENFAICSSCGGVCCKRAAGIYHPEQVKDILENIDTFDGFGKTHQIDCWSGNPDIFWLRPVHTNSVGKIRDDSWGGQCVNLTDNGCTLSFDERPLQCQKLEVDTNRNCSVGMSKKDMEELWQPYQHYFNKLEL